MRALNYLYYFSFLDKSTISQQWLVKVKVIFPKQRVILRCTPSPSQPKMPFKEDPDDDS